MQNEKELFIYGQFVIESVPHPYRDPHIRLFKISFVHKHFGTGMESVPNP